MDCGTCLGLAGDLALLCGIFPIWAGAAACEILGLGPEDPAADFCALLYVILCFYVGGSATNACIEAGACS